MRTRPNLKLTLALSCCVALACSDDDGDRLPSLDAAPSDAASPDVGPAVDAGVDAPTPKPDTAPSVDANSADQAPLADSARACPVAKASWGHIGGMVAWRDTSTLSGCSAFELSRDRFDGKPAASCASTIAADDADLIAALAAIGDADVVAARSNSGTLYGRDTRPVDGTVFKIMLDGDELLIGSPCQPGSASCKPIPAGLTTLREKLSALEATQRALPACSALAS